MPVFCAMARLTQHWVREIILTSASAVCMFYVFQEIVLSDWFIPHWLSTIFVSTWHQFKLRPMCPTVGKMWHILVSPLMTLWYKWAIMVILASQPQHYIYVSVERVVGLFHTSKAGNNWGPRLGLDECDLSLVTSKVLSTTSRGLWQHWVRLDIPISVSACIVSVSREREGTHTNSDLKV